VATTDDGYYGRGMYFTSDLRYANAYAELQESKANPKTFKSGSKALPMLLAVVIPGNPYPVTEHPFIPKKGADGKPLNPPQFEMEEVVQGEVKKMRRKPNPLGLLGQACKAGHQSHFNIVDSVDSTLAFPTEFIDDFDDPAKKRVVSDELVIFEGAQALPLFLVYYKVPTKGGPAPTLAAPTGRGERQFLSSLGLSI
jgi:hypothetical protein